MQSFLHRHQATRRRHTGNVRLTPFLVCSGSGPIERGCRRGAVSEYNNLGNCRLTAVLISEADEVIVYPGRPDQFLDGLLEGEIMKMNFDGLGEAATAPAGDANIALAAQVAEQVVEGFSMCIR
jgi:hypothetical protein